MPRVGGHEHLVEFVRSLGKRNERAHMRVGMAFVASEFILVGGAARSCDSPLIAESSRVTRVDNTPQSSSHHPKRLWIAGFWPAFEITEAHETPHRFTVSRSTTLNVRREWAIRACFAGNRLRRDELRDRYQDPGLLGLHSRRE